VDGAYVSAGEIVKAEEEGRELVGPAQPAPSPRNKGFSAEAFQVFVEERRAVCPAGKESTQCSRLEEDKTGKVAYFFEWSWECADCPGDHRANQLKIADLAGDHPFEPVLRPEHLRNLSLDL
jgi:hypothetical protein